MRGALRADHHPSQVGPVVLDQLAQHLLVPLGIEIGEPGGTAGADEEVAVERHRALLGRPGDQPAQLPAVPLVDRGLDDEVEPMGAEALQRGCGGLVRADAMAEAVVAAGVERVHAHSHAGHPRGLEPSDPVVGQQGPVGAHYHGRPAPRGEGGDGREVVAEQRLTAAQDEDGRGIEREDLPRDPQAFVGGELAARGLLRPGGDVAVGALQITPARQVPRDDVRHEAAADSVRDREIS